MANRSALRAWSASALPARQQRAGVGLLDQRENSVSSAGSLFCRNERVGEGLDAEPCVDMGLFWRGLVCASQKEFCAARNEGLALEARCSVGQGSQWGVWPAERGAVWEVSFATEIFVSVLRTGTLYLV